MLVILLALIAVVCVALWYADKVEREGKTEYLVFFKAKDVDVMTAAFKEYTSETLKKQKRESVRQKLERVKEELSNHRQLKKEKKREQEPTR